MPTLQPLPPYAVRPAVFAFPALAQRAARLGIGGEREVALAAFQAARFANASLGPARLGRSQRQVRVAASRVWFGTLALPSRARLAVQRVVDACAGDDRLALAAGLEELVEVTAPVLDRAATAELRALVRLAARDESPANA